MFEHFYWNCLFLLLSRLSSLFEIPRSIQTEIETNSRTTAIDFKSKCHVHVFRTESCIYAISKHNFSLLITVRIHSVIREKHVAENPFAYKTFECKRTSRENETYFTDITMNWNGMKWIRARYRFLRAGEYEHVSAYHLTNVAKEESQYSISHLQ